MNEEDRSRPCARPSCTKYILKSASPRKKYCSIRCRNKHNNQLQRLREIAGLEFVEETVPKAQLLDEIVTVTPTKENPRDFLTGVDILKKVGAYKPPKVFTDADYCPDCGMPLNAEGHCNMCYTPSPTCPDCGLALPQCTCEGKFKSHKNETETEL